MMHIDEIRNSYNRGEYTYKADIPKKVRPDHIFDEELSVRRNRELVQEHNDNVDQLQRDKNRKQRELNEQFTKDVVEYIMAFYNLTEKQARILENFVYDEHHSYMGDYFTYIDSFASFADDLVNAKEDN